MAAFDFCRPGERVVVWYPMDDEERVVAARFMEGFAQHIAGKGWSFWRDADLDAFVFSPPQLPTPLRRCFHLRKAGVTLGTAGEK